MASTTTKYDTQPRRSALDRSTAMGLASTEYDRYLDMMRMLSPPDWTAPTECAGWDVRTMATHVLGMAEMAASMRENLRQNLVARRRGGVFIDALTGLQVEERASLRPDEIVGRFARVAPRAGKGRRRTPALIRQRTLPVPQRVSGTNEAWTFGYLVDTILTRDTWMHRVDTARATARAIILTTDHDGVLVADVAAEWAGRHGQPVTLCLTGAAGGTWEWAGGGPRIELDAVEFCRILSGRATGEGLMSQEVPF